VFWASLSLGLSLWRAIKHDSSKFTRAELPHYQRQFYGDKGDPEGFAVAWLHHQNHNDHHWEYWITRSDHSHGRNSAADGCLPMPQECVREMIADWLGASRTYTNSWDVTDWLKKNLAKMRLHPRTYELIHLELNRLGYKVDDL
jgi:hypothetical protein